MAIRGFEQGIFSILSNSIAGLGEKLSKLGAAISEGLGGNASPDADVRGSIFAGISGLFGGGDSQTSAPSAAPDHAPSLEVATPAPSLGKYEVSMADLGGFSAPTFGSMPTSRGTGMSA